MKKYMTLFAVTLLAVGAIFWGGSFMKGQVYKVDVVTLCMTEEQNSITCAGRVESAKSRNVYAYSNLKTKEIYVNVGDRVEAGEVLMCVSPVSSADSPKSSATVSSNPLEGLDIPQNILDQYGITSEQVQAAYNSYSKSNSSSPSVSSSSSPANATTTDGKKLEDITAPTSGIVSDILISEKETAATGKSLLVISDENKLQVRLSVNESQIANLQVGQPVTITGVGFQNSEYAGTVKQIANVAKQSVSTSGQETVVEVLVNVDERISGEEEMKAGYTAKCKITTSSDSGVLLVPYEAVLAEEDGSEYVYTLQTGKAVKRAIQTGREFENGFEVLSGLKSGEQIVVTPGNLYEGARALATERELVNSHV